MSHADVVVTGADPAEADLLADAWVSLALGQREHGSHLRAEANRTRVRELFARYSANDRLLVARPEADGDPVGFVMFRTRSGQYEVDCVRGLVENLYVAPDHRGAGIGSTLLAAAERRLRERGVEVVSLEAMAQNSAARRFYRRHGYETHRIGFEKSLDG